MTMRILGIDLAKLLEWLGFIFAWDDILKTHDVLKANMRTGFDLLIDGISKSEGAVEDLFRTLETDLVVEFMKIEAVVAKPLLEEWLFGPSFVRHEMAGDRLVAVDDAGIGSKHHVRQFRLRIDFKRLAGHAMKGGVLRLSPMSIVNAGATSRLTGTHATAVGEDRG